eukprot:Phypoly_transcript_11938.p1 GENE.Phypoly_transcript_11938~~Phypoly_transcript_11938.p1  ORF type:complete len:304 (-),score=32.51 Phypoly_transcript_11938:264-1133(-)
MSKAQTHSKAREEFVDKSCEDFICSICLCIPSPDSAVEATCCGNFFCLPCITRSRQQKEVCPDCNGCFRKNPLREPRDFSKFAYKKLMSLGVFCSTKFTEDSQFSGECTWQGSWSDLQHHLKNCEFVKVTCPNRECRVVLPRCVITDHLSTCVYRMVACGYCLEELVYHQLKNHQDEDCQYKSVDCPYGCGAGDMRRKELVQHYEVCPNFVVSCALQGCDAKMERRASAAHMQEATAHHFQLLFAQVAALQQSVESNNTLVCDLANTIRDQMTRISTLENAISRFKRRG